MLIIKKFHDYYDTALGVSGVDKTVVYDRAPKRVEAFGTDRSRANADRYSDIELPEGLKINYRLRCIGFCGSIYPVVTIVETHGAVTKTVEKSFYSSDEVISYMRQMGALKNKNWFSIFGYGREYKYPFRADMTNEKEIKAFFDSKNWDKLRDKFREYNVPIFVLGHYSGLEVNPRLLDYQFAKIKDPFSAFQEIYMYISGVLGISSRPTVQISDKDMAHKKGHGGKYSFKTPPGRKKRGKKRDG